MALERTLVLLKPDAIQRSAIGTIISRLEQKGLKLIGLKMLHLTRQKAEAHYESLRLKSYYDQLCQFMTSGPIVACCWEGVESVSTVRSLCGATNSRNAPPGTIRGDLSMSVRANLVHASDSVEAANAEISRFFDSHELVSYGSTCAPFVYPNLSDE